MTGDQSAENRVPAPPYVPTANRMERKEEKKLIVKGCKSALNSGKIKSVYDLAVAVLGKTDPTDTEAYSLTYEGRISYDNVVKCYEILRKKAPEIARDVLEQIEDYRSKQGNPGGVRPVAEADLPTSFLYVGNKVDAIQELFRRRADIIEIWNTHIVTRDQVRYDEVETDAFYDFFRDVLSRRGVIVDVIGGEPSSQGLIAHKVVSERILGNPEIRDDYKLHEVPLELVTLPFMNFIMCNFHHTGMEVYFGWGGYPDERYGHVFRTDHRQSVSMFQCIHKALVDMAISKE